MKEKKSTDYFVLNNLMELDSLDHKLYTSRDISKVDIKKLLPIGTLILFKKDNSSWIIIDRNDTHYMLALANGKNNKALLEKNSRDLIGFTYQAFKIEIEKLNTVFGFDKDTGVTPINSAGVLSNIVVITNGTEFDYTMTPMSSIMLKTMNPVIIVLLESILEGFQPEFYDETLKTQWDNSKFLSEATTIYSLTHTLRDGKQVEHKVTIVEAMTMYSMILSSTGEFINKSVVELKS